VRALALRTLSLSRRDRRRLRSLRRSGRRPGAPSHRTLVLGVVAAATTAAVAGSEFLTVWRRGRAPLPTQAGDVLGAGREAALETVEVAVEGYRAASPRETALINLLASYTLTFAIVRLSTWTIRSRGTFGPFRDLKVDGRHIHHFVPGIVLAFSAGGVAIVSRREGSGGWLAIPFGVGAALTLDESALLLELEDVYWTPEGVVSVQIALGASSLLGGLTLALRLLRRGEREVLPAFDRRTTPDRRRAPTAPARPSGGP